MQIHVRSAFSGLLAPCHGTAHLVSRDSLGSIWPTQIRRYSSSPFVPPLLSSPLVHRSPGIVGNDDGPSSAVHPSVYRAQEGCPYRAIIFAWFRSPVRLRRPFRPHRVPIAAARSRTARERCECDLKSRAKPNSGGANVRLCPPRRRSFLCFARNLREVI